MKIALVGGDAVQQFPVIDYGGIEICVEHLAEGLSYFSNVEFACFIPKRIQTKEMDFEIFEAEKNPPELDGNLSAYYTQFREAIRAYKPDIILCQSYISCDALSDLGIPILATFHDSCLKQPGWMKNKPNVWYRFLSQFQYRNWVQEAWEHQRSFQLYSGVISSDYSYEEATDDYYLWVGGLGNHKGIDIFAGLAQYLPERKFIAYGTGTEQVVNEVKAIENQIPNFKYAGILYRGQEHDKVFANAKMVVIPTRIPDTLPRVMFESLCKGTPILGSANGSLPEIVPPSFGFTTNSFPHMVEYLKADVKINRNEVYDYSFKFHIDKEVEGLISIFNKIL